MMIRALGLARVSTTEQSTPDHFSLSHQAGVIRDYTRQHQCDLMDPILGHREVAATSGLSPMLSD